VHNNDLDDDDNGQRYFAEAMVFHYQELDSNRDTDNFGYREVVVAEWHSQHETKGPHFELEFKSQSTTTNEPVIYAWQDADASVSIEPVSVDGDTPPEYFVGCKEVWEANGVWFFTYTIQNIMSDTAVDAVEFVIDDDSLGIDEDLYFHAVAAHSGDARDTDEWDEEVVCASGYCTVRFEATDAESGEYKNAIGWGLAFTFEFLSEDEPNGASDLDVKLYSEESLIATVDIDLCEQE